MWSNRDLTVSSSPDTSPGQGGVIVLCCERLTGTVGCQVLSDKVHLKFTSGLDSSTALTLGFEANKSSVSSSPPPKGSTVN